MAKYAVIDPSGLVENSIVVDGDPSKYPLPDGYTLIQHDQAGPGWTYEGGDFTAPVVEPPILTAAEALAAALAPTETSAVLARTLEEVVDYIENGTPISQEVKDRNAQRKAART